MVSNDAGGVDVSSCMGIEDVDGVGGVIRVLCSGMVGGRVKFESGWSRVAGVVGVGGEMARFAAESLAGVVGVVRVVGVAGIAVLFSENGVPVSRWS